MGKTTRPRPLPKRGGQEVTGRREKDRWEVPIYNVLRGQKVDPALLQRARELRRHMTFEEESLWQYLRANRLAGRHFRRQQVIGQSIVDFYCHAAGLVVEVDGGVHQEQHEHDEERDARLAALGLRVLHVANEEVAANLPRVLERIARACGEPSGGHLPPPV